MKLRKSPSKYTQIEVENRIDNLIKLDRNIKNNKTYHRQQREWIWKCNYGVKETIHKYIVHVSIYMNFENNQNYGHGSE